MIFSRFMRDNATWLSAGAVLSFSSSFGQTFFIALFADSLRTEFNLSNGDWGGIYTVATAASAVVLVVVGKSADILRVRTLAIMAYAGLAGLAIAMAHVNSIIMLGIIIFGLRLCGQGMMTHISITAMGRWFSANRGRAVAIASFGFPVAESTLPIIVVSLSAVVDWRVAWLIAATFICLVLMPAIFYLLRHERKPSEQVQTEDTSGMYGRHWTRKEVLSHWFFWALSPGLLASPFIGTSILFHQIHIVEIKGWSLAQYVLAFPAYPAFAVVSTFISGVAIDRFGSLRLLSLYLLPLALALLIIASAEEIWMAYIYFALFGTTSGMGAALLGTMWAEFFGTKNLGAVRALSVALMVFASALGPGVTGYLIDWGLGYETQCYFMAAYIIVISFLLFPLIGRKISRERSLAGSVAK